MPITIAIAQIDITFADRERNLARMIQVLEETAAKGAKLTVFPEAALAGYCFDSLDEARPHAEPIPGPSTERMTSVCQKAGSLRIYGLLEADGERIFNACVLVGPDGVVGSYRKIHLPYLGVDRFTTPGDRPFAVHEAAGMRIGMHICYDGGFPESARVHDAAGGGSGRPADELAARRRVHRRLRGQHAGDGEQRLLRRLRPRRRRTRLPLHRPVENLRSQRTHPSPNRRTTARKFSTPRSTSKKPARRRIIRVPKLHEIDRIRDRRPEMYGEIVRPKPQQAESRNPENSKTRKETADGL